jgi:exopolysaccharide/PEP-CTERM locus tyrosine autokinase
MGKIQDAIRKVQRNRSVAISSGSDARRPTTINPKLISQVQAGVVLPDQSAEQRRWDYRGLAIRFDLPKLVEAGLLDPDHTRKHLASEYRQVKKSLLADNVFDDASGIPRKNLIMVGSAERGEGRSFICLNLSMSLAIESGHSIVLVDSDIDNPRLSELIGIGDEKGLVDLLADPSLDPMQMISPTDVSGLSVLPAGNKHEHTAELFASERATKLFEDMAVVDPMRIFVFDSSPILLSTAGPALAEQVGQILFVLHAGKTLQQSVHEALGQLDSNRPISILMNQVID